MAAERLSMRKVRLVLRLKHVLGMSDRRISAATGVGKTQAADCAHSDDRDAISRFAQLCASGGVISDHLAAAIDRERTGFPARTER
jgi:hypothetical protein